MTTGGLVLIAVGVVLVWLGLAGYQDWGPAQRAIALILGGADAGRPAADPLARERS